MTASRSRMLWRESMAERRKIKLCTYHDCGHRLRPGPHTTCTPTDGNPACVRRGPRLTAGTQCQVAFGWQVDDGAVYPDPEKWPILAAVVDALESGLRVFQVARAVGLNAKRVYDMKRAAIPMELRRREIERERRRGV